MTDKEEIIIDGVDVSKCRYFLKDTEGQDYNTDEFVKGCCEAKGCHIGCEFIGYSICRGDKDCYYKQLKRKEQECEELKEIISDFISDNRTMYCYDDRQPVTLEEIQECMEFTYNTGLKYKQALEKISEIAKSFNNDGLCFYDDIEDCVNCDMKTDCNYLRKIEIMKIINKAKDSE